MQSNPQPHDAVLGGNQQALSNQAVLGSIEGARRRYRSAKSFAEQLEVLNALTHQYNAVEEAKALGVELVIQRLMHKAVLCNAFDQQRNILMQRCESAEINFQEFIQKDAWLLISLDKQILSIFYSILQLIDVFNYSDKFFAKSLKSALTQGDYLCADLNTNLHLTLNRVNESLNNNALPMPSWIQEAETAAMHFHLYLSEKQSNTKTKPSKQKNNKSSFLQGVEKMQRQ